MLVPTPELTNRCLPSSTMRPIAWALTEIADAREAKAAILPVQMSRSVLKHGHPFDYIAGSTRLASNHQSWLANQTGGQQSLQRSGFAVHTRTCSRPITPPQATLSNEAGAATRAQRPKMGK